MSSIICAATRNPTKLFQKKTFKHYLHLFYDDLVVHLVFAPVGSLYLLGLSAIEVHLEEGLNIFDSIWLNLWATILRLSR